MPIDNDCPKDSGRHFCTGKDDCPGCAVGALPFDALTADAAEKISAGVGLAIERVMDDHLAKYASDSAVVNLAMAADNALDLLQAMFPPSPDGAYVEVVAKLKLALEAVDGGR